INLPVIERLDVTGYGLYPGQIGTGESGLHIEFKAGLTVVLGTNGLGKTTLVSIIFRMLTGTHDIPGIAGRAELGNLKLEVAELKPKAKASFASRVSDNAANAQAQLRFRLGDATIVVERRLRDMALTRLEIGNETVSATEATFQERITSLVGVWSFADWILILRHLTFYFEDRRALVWDPTAQRQIFRALLLSPDIAREWSEEEREILEADSRIRNINSVLGTLEKQLARVETATEFVADVRQEIETLLHLQRVDKQRVETLDGALLELESQRELSRQRLLQVEMERESRFRDVEHLRLIAISTRFPSSTQTARYLLAQLMSANECLVCGHLAHEAAAHYAQRIDDNRCVLCESALEVPDGTIGASELADKRMTVAFTQLAAIDTELAAAQAHAAETARAYDDHSRSIGVLRTDIMERASRIDSLRR
ncbi:MAG TPA: AAA family ATPase, partial [Burkholderiaceae bacterium]|nr:AAA family ATPase [Burkholderiaceae bacterium]